jgi:hypothetical protein
MLEALDVSFPFAEGKIEIVLSILLRRLILLGDSRQGLQKGNQAAQKKVRPNRFERVHPSLL